jgi:hypothetical protein
MAILRWIGVRYSHRCPESPPPAPESISDKPRSASAIVGALVFALTIFGMIDASMIRRP